MLRYASTPSLELHSLFYNELYVYFYAKIINNKLHLYQRVLRDNKQDICSNKIFKI